MAPLVLFRALASPPVRSVMMLGDILGLKFEYRDVELLQFEHKSEEYKKNLNPMGTVPVLQDGDFILSESHAILKYLTERYGGDKREQLYPSEVQARAIVDQCMFFNAGYFFPRMASIAMPLLLHGVEKDTAKLGKNIEEAYRVVDEYLRSRRFVAADHFTLADLSVGATATAVVPFIKFEKDRYPRFSEWMNEIQQMPCFMTINAEGVAYLKKFVAKARAANSSKTVSKD